MMNGVWKEEANIIPSDGASYDNFGRDLDISRDTAIMGSPLDDNMGSESGSVYVFIRQDGGTWEEVHKATPTDK